MTRGSNPHSKATSLTSASTTPRRTKSTIDPLHSTAQQSTAQQDTTQHSTPQRSTAHHTTPQHGRAQQNPSRRSTANGSPQQHTNAPHNTTRHGMAQQSREPHSTAQNGAPRHSKTHHSTTGYMKAHYGTRARNTNRQPDLTAPPPLTPRGGKKHAHNGGTLPHRPATYRLKATIRPAVRTPNTDIWSTATALLGELQRAATPCLARDWEPPGKT